MSRAIATILLSLSLVGGFVLPVAPCVGRAWLPIAFFYAGGSLICHQRPDRSLYSCGRQWPVCGRCSGLYLGGAAGAALALAGAGRRGTWRQWRARVVWAAAPTALLWLVEVLGQVDPGTPVRLALALPPGVTTALWLSAVARGDLR